jgi:hypothetical protein
MIKILLNLKLVLACLNNCFFYVNWLILDQVFLSLEFRKILADSVSVISQIL